MGVLSLEQIVFSEQVQAEWADSTMYKKLQQGIKFQNPSVALQVKI